MRMLLFIAVAALVCGMVFAQDDPGDAPELARRGPWKVGVRTLDLINPGQVDILHFDAQTGKAPVYDRPLKVEVWYPAVLPPGTVEKVVYESAMPVPAPGVPAAFRFEGRAARNAPPVRGQSFPLVVVSHGYPGSRTFLSYLTENLASKGYVVAAIDHTDSVFGEIRDFSSTLLNRAADQWFTIDALSDRSRDPESFLSGMMDPSRVAIIGYSMGGYGALASAGAGYSKEGSAARLVHGGYLEAWMAGNPKFEGRRRDALKAVVAISPWGEQPPNNNWDAPGLAGIRIPSLFIVGDQDDVSGYEQGVRRVFEGAIHSNRYMLVYENARHNVGGNPPPPEVFGNFTARAFFDEPVWRKERIASINQHFVTAFLDLYLKGDEACREYLDVPERSNDGKWVLPPGRPPGAAFSTGVDGSGNRYWRGFQRRWALGVQMYHRTAAQP